MNGRTQVISWATVTAAVALVATHGSAFLEALAGLPALISAWSTQMPFGAASFLLSLGVSAGVCAFALRWLPDCDNDAGRHFIVESAALVVAVVVSVLQQRSSAAGDLLTALWLGLLAGFAAPWLVRGARATVAGVKGAKQAERKDGTEEG